MTTNVANGRRLCRRGGGGGDNGVGAGVCGVGGGGGGGVEGGTGCVGETLFFLKILILD